MEKKFEDNDFYIKFLVLGDSHVGKTCILHRMIEKKFNPNFAATVGIDFKEKILNYESPLNGKSRRIKIQIWDTAGSERFRSLTRAFYRDAVGFLMVFDLTKESSFSNVEYWINELRLNAYVPDPDIILIGNKLDLVESRVIDFNRAIELVENNKNMDYIETSALNGKNINTSLELLLNQVMLRIEKNLIENIFPVKCIKARPEKENKANGCC
jgi:small GTP-binding protein